MKLLAIGDIVAKTGIAMLQRTLPDLRRRLAVDFCVVNGENAATFGLSPDDAEQIFACGADVITLGNHALDQRDIAGYLEDHPALLRPCNLSHHLPGRTHAIFPLRRETLCVISLLGTVGMNVLGAENPFFAIDRLLRGLEGQGYTFIVDFHAEATSEKLAMAYFLKDRAAVTFGTHTHVQTNDARLIGSMGFVCDLGMTGCADTVIGFAPQRSVDMFLGKLKGKYPAPSGPAILSGALFTLEGQKCTAAQLVSISDADDQAGAAPQNAEE